MPRPCDKNMTIAKKAAEVLFAAQQRASQFGRAGKNSALIPSIRQTARDYGVSYTAIEKHLCTLRAGGNLRVSPDEGGRPRAITDAEDAALAAFVIWLAEAGFPALPIQVEETANYLRDLRELQKKAAIKPVEIYRKGAELDPAPIEDFFARYRAIVREYDLGPLEIWNADESGC
ncbi:hypothetical protein CI238_13183 [Colletotrichum incanum]|uniref:Uncharacterized protein n=1 Tax=Colletotrichum incanum TaxID=1573173 RepID=A0A167BXZ1_COLIC|nr:hypothetical protein CI238_13183 [Colletotrichum incanum]